MASNRWSDGKQDGNPNGRSEYGNNTKQIGSQMTEWTSPIATSDTPPVISGTGFLIKETNTLRAELERSRQRATQAIARLKATAANKAEFLERLADQADHDLEETKTWHDALGI